ncbi:MAG: hypothetical protein M3N29_08990 [Chloroflexota bacterium]|nr:hypothetical protein [Chloroflexota bacterium]
MPRIPYMGNVVVDGVPFVDLRGRKQNALIEAELDKQRAEAKKNDPGALTAAERAALDAAEARLAKAQADHDAAVARSNEVRLKRWRAATATSAIDVARRIVQPVATEAALEEATRAKERAEHELHQTLMERNRVYQAVDKARQARRLAKAEWHVPFIERRKR